MKKRRLLLTALAVPALAAPPIPKAADTPQDDPVVKARTNRAAAAGVDERDLPPVPRTLVEPPPLPPSETHPKDMPGYRAKHRHGRRGKHGARPRRSPRHR